MFILGHHRFIKKRRSDLISGWSQIIMLDTQVTPCYSHKKKLHSANINMSPFMACRSVGEPPASCSGFIYQATLRKQISAYMDETRLATLRIRRFVLISLFYKLGKKGRKSWHSVFSAECRSFAIKLQQTHLENLLNHI